MNKEDKRIVGFDVARGFSIIWIVAVYHVLPSAHLPLTGPIKTITYSSLGIFTFLSAFLLASRYNFRAVGSIGQFYRKRVLRFYPLFILSSIILYAIGYNSLFATVKGILGISPFWKPHPTTMWYCAMLISLYLLTPFWATGGGQKSDIKVHYHNVSDLRNTTDISFCSTKDFLLLSSLFYWHHHISIQVSCILESIK